MSFRIENFSDKALAQEIKTAQEKLNRATPDAPAADRMNIRDVIRTTEWIKVLEAEQLRRTRIGGK